MYVSFICVGVLECVLIGVSVIGDMHIVFGALQLWCPCILIGDVYVLVCMCMLWMCIFVCVCECVVCMCCCMLLACMYVSLWLCMFVCIML